MTRVSRPVDAGVAVRRQHAPVRRQLTRALAVMAVPLALVTVANLYALHRTLSSFGDVAVEYEQEALPVSRLRASLVAIEAPAYDVVVAGHADGAPRLADLIDDVGPMFDAIVAAEHPTAAEQTDLSAAANEWAKAEALVSAAVVAPPADVDSRTATIQRFDMHLHKATASLADTEETAIEAGREAVARARRLERTTSSLAILGFAIAIAGALVAGRRVSASLLRPIHLLHESALRIGGGDLSHRVSLDRTDELGGLGEAFDAMAERLEANRRLLAHQSFHDSLTGLPNRALLLDRAQHALDRRGRAGGAVAIVVVDLDEFKTVNDSLGHAAGDEVLRRVAQRVAACVRPGDTVARLGGDELAVLVEDIEREDEVTAPAERVLAAVAEPTVIAGREIALSGSAGIAMSWGAEKAEDLLRNADLAMYRSKHAGKSRHTLFEDHMHAEMVERLVLEAQVRHAVDRDEFVLHYQPVVDLRTGAISGVEALVRWQHPERGLLPPGHFIAMAEDTGAIVPIGRWVLDHACQQVAAWRSRHPALGNLTVSVNVSVRQLHEPNLTDHVFVALRRSGLPPEALVLEITETVMMADADLARSRMAELKRLGVRIAVDDFGTGYSSLGYLQSFDIDVLKIDKSFVDGVTEGAEQRAMLEAIIALARALRLTTVAEGIEEDGQHEAMLAMGCTLGQGYLFARPLGVAQLEALLVRSSAEPGGLAATSDA
jgi:diguanylate cyclase (GGDEF)-like protein